MSNAFLKELEKLKKKDQGLLSGSTTRQTISTSTSYNDYTNGFLNELNRLQMEEEERRKARTASQIKSSGLSTLRSKKKEEEEEDDGRLQFFKSAGVFDDGYDFGDVTKTILGTAGDAGLGVLKGIGGVAEGVGDLLTYKMAADAKTTAELFGLENTFGERVKEFAQRNLVEEAAKPADDFLDEYSVLGRTSDAIAQGLGQVATIVATGGVAGAAGLGGAGATALTTGLTGFSGMGSGMSEAYQGGATDEEAATYGLISGASDALTELLFGGLGKSVKAVGLSTGLSSADDMLAKAVSSKIKNQIAKNVVQFGIKAGAEGSEEVLAGLMQAAGKKLTYMSEEEIGKIIQDENLLEQFVVGAFTSGIAQSGALPGTSEGSLKESIKTGRDFITGFSQNEQAVIKAETEKRIAQQETDGKKLTKNEKRAIEAQVEKDMDKGFISTDTIEETLGGETYQNYKKTIDSEDALVKQEKALSDESKKLEGMVWEKMTGEQQVRRDELRNLLPELRSKIEAQKKNSSRDQLKSQLGKGVMSIVQGDRLVESYNELGRRREAFKADLTKYDAKQQAVIKKAVDSGILNNTNRTHEFVDLVAKISADKGVLFDFTNNAKLKESGFALDGKSVNGFVNKDGVTVNIQSSKALNTVVGHEITHVLEGTDLYTELQNAVVAYAKTKGDYQSRYDTLSELYKGVEGANVDAELTADLVGDYLFTDSDFINRLSTENRNVFQKVFDEVKYLLKIATAGSKEARELEKVKRAFEKAYQESATKNTADSGVKYSIRKDIVDVNGKEYDSVVELDKTVSQRTLSEPKRLLNYIEKNLVGLKIPVADASGNTEVIEFAGANETVTKNGKRHPALGELAYTKGDTRKRVIVNAQEVIEESVYDPNIPSSGNNHGWLDKNGWETRKTYVLTQDGMLYEAYLKIAKAQDGRNILYAVNLDINKGIAVDKGATSKKAAVLAAMPGDMVAQKEETVNRKFASTDTTGRQLSKEQQEYFKDSKVVDESGNLKVMYHGTPNGDYTIFKDGTYFTDNKEYADRYQNPGASSISTGKVASNPKTFEVYLDIKKPFDINDPEARRVYIEDYIKGGNAMGINPYLSDAEYDKIKTIDWTEGDDLREFLIDNGYDYDGLVLDEGADGGYGDAVESRGTSYVIFRPEQAKNIDNAKPTPDPDTRFSLSEAVEETNDLMAIHNLTGEKLLKSMKLGGLPMPSVAIAKAKDGHGEFGEISLVLNKDTIDPQVSSRNKLYSGDAWTPTYPSVDYKPSEKVLNKVKNKISGLVPYEVREALGNLMFDTDNVSDYLARYNGNMVEAYKRNDAMKYAYLRDTASDISLPVKEADLYQYGEVSNEAVRYFSGKLVGGLQAVEQYRNMSGRDLVQDKALTEAIADAQNFDVLRTLEPGSDEYLEYEKNPVFRAEDVSFRDIDRMLSASRKLMKNGVQQTVDRKAAKELISGEVDQAAYENWLEELFAGVVEKEGIRNNKDYFTPSGNRRSFEALHYEHNLENVIKAMREQGEKGIGNGFGGASIFGASTTEFSSIEEMKRSRDRLQTMSYDDYQELRKGFTDRFLEIATSLPNQKNSFSATDSAAEVLTEAVAKHKTRSGIANYLRRELKGWATYSDQAVDDLIELVGDIRKMPTGYFEAKPQRAVGFDEVAVFVIPYDADTKLKQELLNRGYPIAEYDPKVEGDRTRVLNQFEEYKFSLSNVGEEAPVHGSYNVRGGDIALDTDQEDIAPVREDVAAKAPQVAAEELFPDDLAPIQGELSRLQEEKAALEERLYAMSEANEFGDSFMQVSEEWDAVNKRINELEAEVETDDSDRLNSIEDADAPPEAVNEQDNVVADDVPLTKKLVDDLTKSVKSALAVPSKRTAEVRKMIEEYSKKEFPSRDELYWDVADRFGTYTESQVNEELVDVKKRLRTSGINVADSIKAEIADYGQLMRSNFGKIRFSKDGLPVDVAYREFQEVLPGYFPDGIINPTDQLMHIIELANMKTTSEADYEIDSDTIWEVTDTIINGINEFKQNRREALANKHGKESFQSLMQDADQYVPPVKLDDIAPVRADLKTQTDPDDIAPTFDTSGGQQAFMPEAEVPKKITRKELHQNIMDNIKVKFGEKGFDFDKVLKEAKNLSTFSTVDNAPQRVMEKALGYKEGQVLSDLTVNQVAQNETEAIKWLNTFTNRKKGILAQISKKYHIKPGSKASAAAQMYAEGFYVGENDAIIEYGDRELAADFPDPNVRANIKGLARDPVIRKIYDDTLEAINESRARNAYPEIPRLDNYFLHFRAMEDTFSKLGLPFNPNDIRAKDLPTDLNGVTADLKPGQPYFASAKHRTGKRTSFDLLGGLEKYLSSAKNQIYHIDDIQNLRALRNYIADTYGQANGLEGIDTLTEEEAQDRIEQVYGSHLSTFAKFLNEEANVLAGKTALIDRGLEGVIGRRGITFLDTVNKQVGANMVGFNVSSSLTNFLSVAQAFAKTNKFDFVKAFAQTVANKVGSIAGKTDGFTENSPVIIRRKGEERFYRTPWQKAGDAGYVLMSVVDDISTELIARAKYNELTRKGMDSQQAHIETDKWVSRLMGDRSLGQQPQLYNSKMLGLVTKFQLEVRNQLDSQFYDTIQEAKVSTEQIENGLLRNAKKAAKITSTFVQLAVGQHLFGKAFEAVAGYNPSFDIIEVLIKTFGWDDEEEDEDTVLDNIEQGFLELLGDMPYSSIFTGGRVPIESALPIEQLVTGKDQYGNEKNRWETLGEAAPYYILPGGYGQIKKTTQGLGMFDDDLPIAGSYTDSGNLRFPVEDTPLNRLQAGIFGQYASENARDYFDNERQSLKKKQIEEFVDLDIPIRDYWDYRDGLKDLDTISEKADYINGLDLPIDKKNLLINNIADRKESIDMTDYDDFANFEEFDYASKNPEKYEFLQENGISYSQYKSFDEDTKEEYDGIWNWVKNYPDKVTVSRAVTDNVVEYKQYTKALDAIRADKDENGKTISGTAKAKKVDYINSLDLDYGAKIILFKSEYGSDDTYNNDIVEYLNGRNDISYEETVTILRELGFEVLSDGTVRW